MRREHDGVDAIRREALADAGRVAVEVAHDLNNVLLSIQTLATMLEGRLAKGTTEHEDVVEILRATEQGAAIVHQLVTLAGAAAGPEGRTDPNGSSAALPILTTMKSVQPLDVDAALADMRRLLGRIAGPDVDLVIECEPRLSPVRFNASVLRHIVIDVVRTGSSGDAGGRTDRRAGINPRRVRRGDGRRHRAGAWRS